MASTFFEQQHQHPSPGVVASNLRAKLGILLWTHADPFMGLTQELLKEIHNAILESEAKTNPSLRVGFERGTTASQYELSEFHRRKCYLDSYLDEQAVNWVVNEACYYSHEDTYSRVSTYGTKTDQQICVITYLIYDLRPIGLIDLVKGL